MTATLIMTKQGNRIDGSLKKKAFTFLEKLTTDPTAPGLHIEPILRSADPRVRTGRVDDQFRAVLFQLAAGEDMTFVFHGIWNHDEAIHVAKSIKLDINSVNGMPEIRSTKEIADVAPAASTPEPAAAPIVEAPEPETSEEPEITLAATWDELVNVLGLPRDVADAAVMARTEQALLAAAHDGPEWQHLALLSLATGSTVQEVLEELHLDEDSTPVDEPTDEQLIERLKHPSASIEFAEIAGVDELRRVIDGGDFGAWRIFLHPEQREFASRHRNGAFRLSGGAGTGKTVVVLHRAHQLLRTDPTARVIITTYTVNLAANMQRDLVRLNPGVRIADKLGDPGAMIVGIDAIARRALQGAGSELAESVRKVLGTARTDVLTVTREGQWRRALEMAGHDLPDALRSDRFLAAEYELVILPNLIVDRGDYLRIPRPGRGVRLSRQQRAAVWKVVEEYRRMSEQNGTADFQEVAMIAATHLEDQAASQGRLAEHVLVDEGQDMTPAHWRLVRALVAEGPNDLFIAEDSHQRIYGNKITLSHHGINIRGRSRRLTLNYRTTAQNLHLAVSILAGGHYEDLESGEESTHGYRSARSGPVPRLQRCATIGDELDHAADLLREWLTEVEQPESIAVLVRDKHQLKLVVAGLSERGVETQAVERDHPKPGSPAVMTMHRAKGTEFAKVLLFGISRGSIPINLRDFGYDEHDAADAMLRERSLLYVAASRARDELAVSWHGEPSELLPD